MDDSKDQSRDSPKGFTFSLSQHELFGILGPLLFVLLLILIGLNVDLTPLNNWVTDTGMWAPVFFIIAKASTIVFAPLSGAALYVLVGSFFGFADGLLYVFIGDVIGFSILFFIGRRYGMRALSFLRIAPDSKLFDLIQKGTASYKTFAMMGIVLFWFPELTIFIAGMSTLRYGLVMLIYMPMYTTGASLLVLIGAGLSPF